MSFAVRATDDITVPEDRPPAEVISIRRGREMTSEAALRVEILAELRALASE